MFEGLNPPYRCILIDPPWQWKAWITKPGIQRNYRNPDVAPVYHYRTMPLPEICALPVRDLADRDGCHLFLWATGPCLRHAFEAMDAWGFRYSSDAFVWLKLRRALNQTSLWSPPMSEEQLHVGLGLTTRKNVEYVLLARRGNARRMHKDVRQVIISPVREHSRKPTEIYQRIERYCGGPYVELFARSRRTGWDSWGDETDKYDSAANRLTLAEAAE